MSTATADGRNLDSEILRLLVRFFRSGEKVSLTRDTLRLADDLEYLRIQWALSSQVENLARHLLENRHEAQASLEKVLVCGSGAIRGRLDPVRTVLRRRVTGDYAKVVYFEPRRNYTTGPNHVLAWVLCFSYAMLQRYVQLLSGSVGYSERVNRIFRYLGAVRHLKGIGEVIGSTDLRIRPSIKSITQAGESRRRLYRKAFDAYRKLTSIETGQSSEIVQLLNESLIGPLEDWRKFELLVALKLSEALARHVGDELILRPIQLGADRPIASFGRYDVYWQSRTRYQRFPELEPSERVTQEILRSYGIPVGQDRPDIVICDRLAGTVLTIAEAKYSMGGEDSWKDAFRDAAAQLVRYSRLYQHVAPQDELLLRSVVAVSNLPREIADRPTPANAPVAVGLHELLDGSLATWVSRVALALPEPLSASSSD